MDEELLQPQTKETNLIGGIVGAFLGALIGGALWVLIYRLGYIAGIAGLVAAVCAMKGYEMLGGTIDKKGIVISVLMSVLVIFLANRISWSWDVYDEVKDMGVTFSECFKKLDMVLKESDLMDAYYENLMIGFGLTLLCSFRMILGAFKGAKK